MLAEVPRGSQHILTIQLVFRIPVLHLVQLPAPKSISTSMDDHHHGHGHSLPGRRPGRVTRTPHGQHPLRPS